MKTKKPERKKAVKSSFIRNALVVPKLEIGESLNYRGIRIVRGAASLNKALYRLKRHIPVNIAGPDRYRSLSSAKAAIDKHVDEIESIRRTEDTYVRERQHEAALNRAKQERDNAALAVETRLNQNHERGMAAIGNTLVYRGRSVKRIER